VVKKRKVYAYIVQEHELVVVEHPDFPEAGIQVPGGTVEEGENLDTAVLREAFEETGLQGLAIAHYLGKHERDMRDYGKDEYQERHFYHLSCTSVIPQRWQHFERYPSEGTEQLIRFELYRIPIGTVPELIADMGICLDTLRALLR
jgi:8-oxo-dGTP diphosphatase